MVAHAFGRVLHAWMSGAFVAEVEFFLVFGGRQWLCVRRIGIQVHHFHCRLMGSNGLRAKVGSPRLAATCHATFATSAQSRVTGCITTPTIMETAKRDMKGRTTELAIGEVPDTASCLGCGYSLRGLPENVCPECGRGFVPDAPKTYRVASVKPRWPFLPEAPPRWQAVVLPIGTVVYVYWSSEPGGLLASVGISTCIIIPVGLAALAALALDFVGRIVALWADRERASLDRGERKRGGRLRWAVFPALLVVMLSVFLWSWPMRTRFHLSQPAFDRAVQQIKAGTDPRTLQGSFGQYEVSYIHVYESGAIFFQTGNSGWDKVGVAYRPSDTPRSIREKRLARLWFTEMW